MAVATGTALLIAGLAGAAGSTAAGVYGASQQRRASDRAADIQDRANTEALDFEREQTTLDRDERVSNETQRRAEWQRVMEEERAQWEATEAAREPYRQAGLSSLADLVRRSGGSPFTPPTGGTRTTPDFNRPMPDDWQPGDPTGSGASSTSSSEAPPTDDDSLLTNRALLPTGGYNGAALRRPGEATSVVQRTQPTAPPRDQSVNQAAYSPLVGRGEQVALSSLMRRPRGRRQRMA